MKVLPCAAATIYSVDEASHYRSLVAQWSRGMEVKNQACIAGLPVPGSAQTSCVVDDSHVEERYSAIFFNLNGEFEIRVETVDLSQLLGDVVPVDGPDDVIYVALEDLC